MQVLCDLSRMCIVLRGLGKIFQRRLQPSFPFPVAALAAAVPGGAGGWCGGREDEGPLQGAAAGHDAVGAGMVETADDVVVGADIAVGHDWDADGKLNYHELTEAESQKLLDAARRRSDTTHRKKTPMEQGSQGSQEQGSPKACAVCEKEAKFHCARCQGEVIARYCSRDCQRQHWPRHKSVCGTSDPCPLCLERAEDDGAHASPSGLANVHAGHAQRPSAPPPRLSVLRALRIAWHV